MLQTMSLIKILKEKNVKEIVNQMLIKLIRKILRFPNGQVGKGHKQNV